MRPSSGVKWFFSDSGVRLSVAERACAFPVEIAAVHVDTSLLSFALISVTNFELIKLCRTFALVFSI